MATFSHKQHNKECKVITKNDDNNVNNQKNFITIALCHGFDEVRNEFRARHQK